MVVTRDMYYIYEILEGCFGNFTMLNQINEKENVGKLGSFKTHKDNFPEQP